MLIMRILLLLCILLISNSCKSQQTDYEKNVYQLLNDAYTRNPNVSYIGEDAYVNTNHSLNESSSFLKDSLFDRLLEQSKWQFYIKQDSTLLYNKENWLLLEPLISDNKFDHNKINVKNLHFKNPDVEDVSMHTFFSKIDAVLFNNEFAIIVDNLYDSLFVAHLYVLKDGKYKDIGTVSYPPRANE